MKSFFILFITVLYFDPFGGSILSTINIFIFSEFLDLFENSYLDSLKFLILLNEIEKKFKIKIQFDNKTNLWIRTIDSLAKKIFNLKKNK